MKNKKGEAPEQNRKLNSKKAQKQFEKVSHFKFVER
jgi:hypothetical protein